MYTIELLHEVDEYIYCFKIFLSFNNCYFVIVLAFFPVHIKVANRYFETKTFRQIFRFAVPAFEENTTAWKVFKHEVFSGPHFPVFWLNTEIYSINVNLRIQQEYGKIKTWNNSVFANFSGSVLYPYYTWFSVDLYDLIYEFIVIQLCFQLL